MVDAKTETSEMYRFLAWLEPYIQPRRTTTNLVVVEDTAEHGPEDEAISDDSCSNRSSTPDHSLSDTSNPLNKSKVTGRPKYHHAKRPKKNEGIEAAEMDIIKSIGQHLVNKGEVKDEESLFGELIASQLRKMPNKDRLTTKMEINNIIFNCLLKSSSPEDQAVGYATARYPETAKVEYPERQNMAPPPPQHSYRLLPELGNVESAQTFPPGYFFQHHGHAGV